MDISSSDHSDIMTSVMDINISDHGSLVLLVCLLV